MNMHQHSDSRQHSESIDLYTWTYICALAFMCVRAHRWTTSINMYDHRQTYKHACMHSITQAHTYTFESVCVVFVCACVCVVCAGVCVGARVWLYRIVSVCLCMHVYECNEYLYFRVNMYVVRIRARLCVCMVIVCKSVRVCDYEWMCDCVIVCELV